MGEGLPGLATADRTKVARMGSGEVAVKATDDVANKQQQDVPQQRSIADIEADIEQSRERLVETVGQLQSAVKQAVSPKHIASRAVAKVKGFYVDEYGQVRPTRVAGTVGTVAGVIVVRRVIRGRRYGR